MFLLYSFLLTFVFLACLPYFVYQALVKHKYVANLRERLGLLPARLRSDGRATLWVHCVSVGETLAAAPLVKALRARFPQHRLIISTTTDTGQAVARARLREADDVFYFPFDWVFTVKRVLQMIRPQAVILMESELWPNFLRVCRRQQVPVLVANGRISDRSFARSLRVGWLLRAVYQLVSRWMMQSDTDAQRALALGARPASVSVSGNLKYDLGEQGPGGKLDQVAQHLRDLWQLETAPLIVAGSTTEGEDEIVLAAFQALRAQPGLAGVRLLIAPRHPERFAPVADLIAATGLSWARRTQADSSGGAVDILLLDSIGELAALYQFAATVFVGGSLLPKGGHNILEPALYGKPVVVGPYMHNFREITQEFLRREALVQLAAGGLTAQLAHTWQRLLSDPGFAQQLGHNAQQTMQANRGATARTVEAVAALLGKAKS